MYFRIGTAPAHARLKMARTLRRLMAKLRAARLRVRRLELLLLLAEREEAVRCQHTWVKQFPGGHRDNNECSWECERCGTTHGR